MNDSKLYMVWTVGTRSRVKSGPAQVCTAPLLEAFPLKMTQVPLVLPSGIFFGMCGWNRETTAEQSFAPNDTRLKKEEDGNEGSCIYHEEKKLQLMGKEFPLKVFRHVSIVSPDRLIACLNGDKSHLKCFLPPIRTCKNDISSLPVREGFQPKRQTAQPQRQLRSAGLGIDVRLVQPFDDCFIKICLHGYS